MITLGRVSFLINNLFSLSSRVFSFCFGCVLFSKKESFVLELSFDFFGYSRIFYLIRTILLWFCVASRLPWLVYVKSYIPSNRVKRKFETCEDKLELLLVRFET